MVTKCKTCGGAGMYEAGNGSDNTCLVTCYDCDAHELFCMPGEHPVKAYLDTLPREELAKRERYINGIL